jgi:hypothetical protein
MEAGKSRARDISRLQPQNEQPANHIQLRGLEHAALFLITTRILMQGIDNVIGHSDIPSGKDTCKII